MKPTCAKCKSSMEEGFVLDRGESDMKRVSAWLEGKPERAWWGLKTKGRQMRAVQTFRCTKCGYLESYAVEPTK